MKTFFISMGLGVAVGALGVMMLPKSSSVYRATRNAAGTIKKEAGKIVDSMTDSCQ